MTLPPFVYKHRWFMALVVAPTLLVAVYYGLIAADRFQTEARFVVKSAGAKPTSSAALANLLQSEGISRGTEHTEEVIAFVQSRDALNGLGRAMDMRRVYGAGDVFSRWPMPFGPDRFEGLYRYYKHMVSASVDSDTGLAVLTVDAFTPGDALAINRNLLDQSEALVNRLNVRAQAQAISEAQAQVDIAEARVSRARAALAAYRNQSELLDPTTQGKDVIELSSKLVADRAALQAQLDLMRRVAPANPAIPAIASRVGALSAQIAGQDSQATGGNGAIAGKLTRYEQLDLEQTFAAQQLTTANANLTQAEADAAKQQFYLERVVEPVRPDLAELPHRLRIVLIVAATLALLYFIGWMLIVGVAEHTPED